MAQLWATGLWASGLWAPGLWETTDVGASDAVVILVQPAGAVNGLSLATQPQVKVNGPDGNTLTSYDGRFKVILVSGNAQIIGDTIYAVAGVGTYTALRLDGSSTQLVGFVALDLPDLPGVVANPIVMAPSAGGSGTYSYSIAHRRGHR